VAVASRDDCLDASGFCPSPGESFEEWKLAVPAAASAAVGGLVGYFVRTPAWVPGFLPAPSADAGMALGLSWSLPIGPRGRSHSGA